MIHNYYELSHAQKRIWYTELLHPGTAFANLAGRVILNAENVDFQLLRKAVNKIIERYDALRIRLSAEDGYDVKQYITDYKEKDFETIQGEFLEEWITEQSRKAFMLMESELFYFALIRLPGNRGGYYFKYHHIICDAMTVTLLNKQICSIYKSLVKGEEVTEENQVPSFIEFLDREKGYLSGELYKEDEAFWQREFRDVPEPLDLCPQQHSVSASIKAERMMLNLGERISTSIDNFCKENHTTVFRFFMSVFYVYFLRTTSNDDIVIATGHHNRRDKRERQLAGMTVSTLPIRITADSSMDFIKLLNYVTEKVAGCLSHQQYPFELLASELRQGGSEPGSLMNIMLNHIPSLTEGDYSVERYTPGFDPALLNIKINPNQLPPQANLEIAIDYRGDIFSSDEVHRLFERLKVLITEIINAPGRKLYEFEILPQEERECLLKGFNDTRRSYPGNICFIDSFTEQVKKTPDNIAMVYKERRYTYSELDMKTNKLAAVLRRKGVTREVITVIMVKRSEDFLIGALSVLKAGGAYLPIDPNSPRDRIDFMLEDSKAKIILSQSGLEEKVKTFVGEWIDLGDENIYEGEGKGLENINCSYDAAYIIYTSGSTGNPKGVVVEHRNLINFSMWYKEFFQLKTSDVLGAYCSFTFDVSVGELFPPLLAGMAVHIIPEEIRLSTSELNEYYEKEQINLAVLPTRMGEIFMEAEDNKSLRVLTIVGEKMNRYISRGYSVVNAYGPTETTIYATAAVVDEYSNNIPIGKPIANTWAYVLDRWGRLVPIGAAGELWLSGAQVSRGYLNRPQLTEEKFIKNPFSTGDIDAMVYKTGDLVRWLPDGNLEFLGRMDGQVKIRGFRVEVGEIEQEILKYQGIREAVVIAADRTEGSKYLLAYVTVKDKSGIESLKKYLHTKLPEYMVPEQIIVVDSIPMTGSGKRDRSALLKLIKDIIQESGEEIILPRTVAERKLYEIWRELLQLEQIGITENFFNMGGNSLLAMRLFLMIKENFKVSLPVSLIYRANTIEQLAQLIDGKGVEGISNCVLIKEGKGESPLFCIHDFSGEVLTYSRIAHSMGAEVPVYGIRYAYKPGDMKRELESLASDYIREVQAIQPEGPYRLMGYSSGGTIAYEMAQQLVQEGEKVELLAFLDTPNYNRYPVVIKNIYYAVARYALNWLKVLSFKDKVRFITANAKTVLGDIFQSVSRNKHKEYRTFAIQKNLQAMLANYVPRNYSGKLLLFRAGKRSIEMDEKLGWDGLIKEIEVYQTAGHHVSIMNKENINKIAEVLKEIH